jgi:nicotinate dehydrogenase large molybdopterin subunit
MERSERKTATLEKEEAVIPPVYEEDLRAVGKNRLRVDGYDKVTGGLQYGADLEYPGCLIGKAVRSPYAHAIIRSIDTAKASSIPGVKAILTAKDVPGRNSIGTIVLDQPALCGDKVRYIGDAVALVAAETEEAADKAIGLIEVDYELLPGIFSVEDALKPDAPKIHETGNLLLTGKIRRGNIEEGFGQADVVLERTYTVPFQDHASMEPEVIWAVPHPDGTFRMEGPMQTPFLLRKTVASVLGIPFNRVQSVQTPLGGGFGGKEDSVLDIGSKAALLARATGRPVKIELAREETALTTSKRHPMKITCTIGAKKDGTFLAFEGTIYNEQGAYASLGALIPPSSGVHMHAVTMLAGPYVIPNVTIDGYLVYTNNPYGGAMRGFGVPQVNFAHESLIDELAEKLGMDPYDLRLKNAFELGSETSTGQVLDHSVGLKDAMEKTRETFHWNMRKGPPPALEQIRSSEKSRGVGIAIGWYKTGLGSFANGCGANLYLLEDGSAILSQGLVEMGQGLYTVLAQIAAEALGIDAEDVRVIAPDTDRAPDSGATVASRSTTVAGMAILEAAKQIREPLFKSASEILGVPPERLEAKDRLIYDRDDRNRCIELKEAALRSWRSGRRMMGQGWWNPPVPTFDMETGQGSPNFVYSYSAQMAEVEVDLKTGEVKVIQIVSAYDVGKAINPMALEGQIEGGVAMGLGYALMEEIVIKDGLIQNLNLQNYSIPTVLDMPDIVPIYVEHPNRYGPYGAKGIAEMANIPVAPAITNAIANAIGARIYDLPANPERVYITFRRRFDEGFCS